MTALFELASGRRGADTLPASWLLFAVLVAVMLALQGLGVLLEFGLAREDYLFALLLTAFGYSVLAAPLWLTGKARRLPQVLTALAGLDVVWSLINIVFGLLLALPGLAPQAFQLPALLLLIWFIYVTAKIMAAALEWPLYAALGLVLAVNLTILSLAWERSDARQAGYAAAQPAEPPPRWYGESGTVAVTAATQPGTDTA